VSSPKNDPQQQSWWFLDKKIIEQYKNAYGGSLPNSESNNNPYQKRGNNQWRNKRAALKSKPLAELT
jgi:hypothetical protein